MTTMRDDPHTSIFYSSQSVIVASNPNPDMTTIRTLMPYRFERTTSGCRGIDVMSDADISPIIPDAFLPLQHYLSRLEASENELLMLLSMRECRDLSCAGQRGQKLA